MKTDKSTVGRHKCTQEYGERLRFVIRVSEDLHVETSARIWGHGPMGLLVGQSLSFDFLSIPLAY